MQSMGQQKPYEVYCTECKVTAPVGTRNCLHCGNRLSHSPFLPSAVAPASTVTPAAFEGLGEEEVPGDEMPRLGGVSPITIVWILLFIGGSLYRLCH